MPSVQGVQPERFLATCLQFVGQCVFLDIDAVPCLGCCSCGSYASASTLTLVNVHSTALG